MNKSDSETRGRSMLSVCVVLALIALCGADQAKAQNPWTTNGNNIYNSNTGNVGIGTAAPLETLHLFSSSSIFQIGLQGGLNNSGFIGYWNPGGLFLSNNRNIRTGNNFNTGLPGAQIVLGNSGDGNTGDISFQTISSGITGTPLELLRMKSNGNIGIGTSNPGRKLEVLAPNGEALRLYRNANSVGWGANMTFAFNNSSNAQVDYAGVHGIIQSNTAGAESGSLVFSTVSSGSSLTERMRVLGSGNVGIGTTNPAKKLHVFAPNSQVFIDRAANTAGNYALVNFGTNGATQFLIGMNADASPGADKLSFFESAFSSTAPVMTITGGNVGVGTTAPGSKFHVAGEIRSSTGGFRFPDGTLQTTAATGGGGGTISGVTAGTGLTGGGTTGSVTLTNADRGSSQSIFKNIANAAGTAQFAAGSNSDTLRFAGAGGTAVTFDAATKKVTIDATGSTGSAANISAGQFGQNTGGGNYTFPGNVTVNGNIAAKYQDVAEWVPASEQIPFGTVVVLDPARSNHVTRSTQSYDTRVAGVISKTPGLLLGESGANKVLVATTGRVRVRVDATRGPIEIGDLLVTSDIEGVAMKSEPIDVGGAAIHRPGTLIGKALEPLAKGRQGEILVLLSLQ
jgi:hypothetical protein